MAEREFGPWLRELRSSANLTQEALAERAAVEVTTVRKWERGDRRPSRAALQRLADTLPLPADQREAFVRLGRASRATAQTEVAVWPNVAGEPQTDRVVPIVVYTIHLPAETVSSNEPQLALPAPKLERDDQLVLDDLAPIQLGSIYADTSDTPQLRWIQWFITLPKWLSLTLSVVLPLLLFGGVGKLSAWAHSNAEADRASIVLVGNPNDRLMVFTSRGRLHNGESVRIGEPVTASFTVINLADHPIYLRYLTALGRGPGAKPGQWDAPHADFPNLKDIWLLPGRTVSYQQTQTYREPGQYFIAPGQRQLFQEWGGLGPASTPNLISFEVVP